MACKGYASNNPDMYGSFLRLIRHHWCFWVLTVKFLTPHCYPHQADQTVRHDIPGVACTDEWTPGWWCHAHPGAHRAWRGCWGSGLWRRRWSPGAWSAWHQCAQKNRYRWSSPAHRVGSCIVMPHDETTMTQHVTHTWPHNKVTLQDDTVWSHNMIHSTVKTLFIIFFKKWIRILKHEKLRFFGS